MVNGGYPLGDMISNKYLKVIYQHHQNPGKTPQDTSRNNMSNAKPTLTFIY